MKWYFVLCDWLFAFFNEKEPESDDLPERVPRVSVREAFETLWPTSLELAENFRTKKAGECNCCKSFKTGDESSSTREF